LASAASSGWQIKCIEREFLHSCSRNTACRVKMLSADSKFQLGKLHWLCPATPRPLCALFNTKALRINKQAQKS
jgi:hypothetical protein